MSSSRHSSLSHDLPITLRIFSSVAYGSAISGAVAAFFMISPLCRRFSSGHFGRNACRRGQVFPRDKYCKAAAGKKLHFWTGSGAGEERRWISRRMMNPRLEPSRNEGWAGAAREDRSPRREPESLISQHFCECQLGHCGEVLWGRQEISRRANPQLLLCNRPRPLTGRDTQDNSRPTLPQAPPRSHGRDPSPVCSSPPGVSARKPRRGPQTPHRPP